MQLTDAHSHNPTPGIITIAQSDSSAPYNSEGVHPILDVRHAEEKLKHAEKLASQSKLCAIGECGMDRESELAIDEQIKVFSRHIDLARSYKLPVIVHCVGKWNELEMIIRENSDLTFVIHGFRKMKVLRQLLHPNVMFSIGYAIQHDETIWEHLHEIPRDQLLIETDDGGFDLMDSYVALARALDLSRDEAITLIANNFYRTFPNVQRKPD